MSGPPPGAYPRLAGLSDLAQIVSGDHAHHGAPPGVTWSWWAFPEAWPLLTLDAGTFSGAGEPLGEAGDLWWFTLADLHDHQPGTLPGWLAYLAGRAAAEYLGPLAVAFAWLGFLPLVWTVPDRSRPVPLAYQPHFRLAFGGSLYTAEQWVCRLNVTSSGTLMTEAEADTALPGCVAALSTFCHDGRTSFGAAAKLEYVKLNRITPTGHYATPGSPRTALVDPAVAGVGASTLPPQVAMVVSLLTGSIRGKAHRGRIYLPCLVGTVVPSGVGAGEIEEGNATNLMGSAHDLIVALNAALPSPNAISVISGTGEARHVTGVAIGRVYDTQQRRRRSLSESPYVLSAVDL